MTLSLLISRLSHVRTLGPGHWLARCPCPGHAHGDATPSLDIRQAPDGMILVYCRSAGHRYYDVLAALDIQPHAPAYVAPPVDASDEIRRAALDMARRHDWLPEAVALRRFRGRIADLHNSADRLGPDDPAAWAMLAVAAALEHEFRLLDVVSDPTA